MRKKHLIFILDRSGSMSGLEEDTIGGYNSFIREYVEDTTTIVSTILFDHEITPLFKNRQPKDAFLATDDYTVRGSTALLDAVGKTITSMREKEQRNTPCHKRVYIITTDGMENASMLYTYQRVHQLIACEREENHEFVFLGANIDSAKEAEKLGINPRFVKQYQATKKGTKAMYQQMDTLVNKIINHE